MEALFHKFAAHFSRVIGSMWALIAVIVAVTIAAFYLEFTDKWTIESIVVLGSFLMLFFLQHSQNVNDKATHLKLDELIRALQGARNEVVGSETRAEQEIDELKEAIVDAAMTERDLEVQLEKTEKVTVKKQT